MNDPPEHEPTGKPLRLTMKLRNNRILEAMEAEGFKSVKAFCRGTDLNYSEVCRFVANTRSPFRQDGTPSLEAVKLAAVLMKPLDWLWPEEVLRVEKPIVERRLSMEEIQLLVAPNSDAVGYLDSGIQEYEDREWIDTVLKEVEGKVGTRAVTIIRRWLLGDRTLEEVGDEFNISRERVRQLVTRVIDAIYKSKTLEQTELGGPLPTALERARERFLKHGSWEVGSGRRP